MGCELWVAKTWRVRVLLGSVETGPLRIGGKVLTDVSLFGRVLRLVYQGQRNVPQKWPLQQRVVLTNKEPDVEGQMGTLSAPIAVREGNDHELVAVLVGEKWRTVHLVACHLLRSF